MFGSFNDYFEKPFLKKAELGSISAGDPRASSAVPACGVSPGSLIPQESRLFCLIMKGINVT
jgi:hypothetical protein